MAGNPEVTQQPRRNSLAFNLLPLAL